LRRLQLIRQYDASSAGNQRSYQGPQWLTDLIAVLEPLFHEDWKQVERTPSYDKWKRLQRAPSVWNSGTCIATLVNESLNQLIKLIESQTLTLDAAVSLKNWTISSHQATDELLRCALGGELSGHSNSLRTLDSCHRSLFSFANRYFDLAGGSWSHSPGELPRSLFLPLEPLRGGEG